MKTSIHNESKNRPSTAMELARAIMNANIECAIESTIADFEYDPTLKGSGLAKLTQEQKEAVLEAMNKLATTLWPTTSADSIDYN